MPSALSEEEVISSELPVDVTAYRSFEEAESVWRDLEATGDAYAFQSFDWLRCWYETVGVRLRLEPWIVLVQDAAGCPLMLLPLGIERRGPLSCLVWLGGEISDYHGPLLASGCSERLTPGAFERIWLEVRACLPRHAATCFEKVPELIGAQRNPFLHLPCGPHPSHAHSARLGGTFDEFLRDRRSKKSISTMKRRARRLGERGEVRFTVATSPGDVESTLDATLRQKSRSYREMGVPDLFQRAGHREFISTLTRRHAEDGFVQLSALILEDRVLATIWGLVHKKRFYHLFPTYETGELARLSPGNHVLWNRLDWCFDAGVEVYDFTVGDEAYKKHWCDRELALFDTFQGHSVLGALYVPLLKASRAIKRRVKRSPGLFSLAKRVRAWRGQPGRTGPQP